MINNKFELKRQIHYNQYTGEFTRLIKQHTGQNRLGKLRGIKAEGKGEINILGNWYMLSRLAWMYMTGSWPDGYVYHIDGDKSNYKWENLRQSSGLGYSITFIENKNRFQVYFKRKYLGLFESRNDAEKCIEKHYKNSITTANDEDVNTQDKLKRA
jgi:hypothetical protein